MIPVSVLVNRHELTLFQSVSDLRYTQQITFVVHDIGIPCGVYPQPLVESIGINDVDHMAIVYIAFRKTSHIAGLESHSQITLVQHLRHHTAINAPILLLANFI